MLGEGGSLEELFFSQCLAALEGMCFSKMTGICGLLQLLSGWRESLKLLGFWLKEMGSLQKLVFSLQCLKEGSEVEHHSLTLLDGV